MNTFLNGLENADNFTLTENGGLAHKTTMNKVYDMFAVGASYRSRSEEDCILLFKNAFEENAELALKCLFWIRDCRSGAGERRYFRVVINWLAKQYPGVVEKNIDNIAKYGRWDDLFVLFDTPVEDRMIELIKDQLVLDMKCQTPSLLGKWCPSINTSSKKTRELAHKLVNKLGLTERTYRKSLSSLRKKINIVETLMSQNRWEEIVFDKLPSKAGLKYRNAFARRDIIAERYKAFIESKNTKVNSNTLFPYEIVNKARVCREKLESETLEKYWDNLPDYCENNSDKMICVIDTSGSMTWANPGQTQPMDIAISLGMYCAERLSGPFKNHFITFSRNPHLIDINGIDFVDKVKRIYKRNECSNTDLEKTFNLLYKIACDKNIDKNDIPSTVIVISDMEIDMGSETDANETITMMEMQRKKWEAIGLKMPRLIYWNANSRGSNKFLDNGPNVSYVSGASPSLFTAILSGKNGIDMMLSVLESDRYSTVTI